MRSCIRCKRNLGEEMGVIVFVPSKTSRSGMRATDKLLCVEHGKNGQNHVSLEEMERLTGRKWS